MHRNRMARQRNDDDVHPSSWADAAADKMISAGKALVDLYHSETDSSESKPGHGVEQQEVKEGFALGKDPADTYMSVRNTGSPKTPSPLYSEDATDMFGAPCDVFHVSEPKYRQKYNKYHRSPEHSQYVDVRTGTPSTCTPPTEMNPFANMLVGDMNEQPERPRACHVNDGPFHKQAVQRAFRANGIYDETDVFDRNASQRQFYTMPSTTFLNDPNGSYKTWLYDLPPTKKEEGLVRSRVKFM